jgi:hypothetical protein
MKKPPTLEQRRRDALIEWGATLAPFILGIVGLLLIKGK